MTPTYWHRQTTKEPLFPDLLWNRPENRLHAGKLLIIGGNLHGFAAAAEAYGAAEKAGIGTARVMLPDALSRTISKMFPEAEFAPSTPSGSFSQQALAELLAAASWADGVLLAGDFGKNSETAVLLESFIQKYDGWLTLTGDTLEGFIVSPDTLLSRADSTAVLDFSQLQKLAQAAHFPQAFISSMDLLHFTEMLHHFTEEHGLYIMTAFADTVAAGVKGKISTTTGAVLSVSSAAAAAVWTLQNPSKPFEALTTSLAGNSQG